MGLLFTVLLWVGAIGFWLSILTYLLPWVFVSCCRRQQNLAKKYNAKWALVTGASSGIGLAVTKRLAKQGLNVVMVAMPDKLLDDSVAALSKEYAGQEFRAVGCNLAGNEFFDQIKDATKDILPQVVICNAGYIKTGFFADTPLEAQVANFNCNAASVVPLAHHFIHRLRQNGARGCVVFTSSPAGFMPCPFSAMYGATKAFLTELACSLAPEVAVDGIDVMVVHPSPVTSNFYQGTHKLDALEMFRKTGTSPDTIANSLFRTVGRHVVCDQGYYSLCVRFLLKVADVAFIAEIIRRTAHTMKDFKEMYKPAGKNK